MSSTAGGTRQVRLSPTECHDVSLLIMARLTRLSDNVEQPRDEREHYRLTQLLERFQG